MRGMIGLEWNTAGRARTLSGKKGGDEGSEREGDGKRGSGEAGDKGRIGRGGRAVAVEDQCPW